MKLATTLSQQFASRGLQFFKVNRTVTHVSVARPRYLDMEATPVSLGVRQIVDFVNATTKCTRRKLIEALAPATPPPAPKAPPAAVPAAASEAAAGATPLPPPAPEASAEQTAVASDLHWLVHEGHVIEFANGILETAKKPFIKPPKPESKAATSTPANAPSPGGEKAAAAETAIPAAVGEAPVPAATAETPASAYSADATAAVATPGPAQECAPKSTDATPSAAPSVAESAIRGSTELAEVNPQSAIPTSSETPAEPSVAPQAEGLAADP